jgi:ribosome-binding protein aMBF1 (putative translation factor)
MIKNEREYRITRAQAEKFRRALSDFTAADNSSVHPRLRKAQEDALRSQLEELDDELKHYEALRSGKRRVIKTESFSDFPAALIQARVSLGLSQRDLAERLGLKEQQIQRYEATNYASASLSRVAAVVAALGLEVKEHVRLPG